MGTRLSLGWLQFLSPSHPHLEQDVMHLAPDCQNLGVTTTHA